MRRAAASAALLLAAAAWAAAAGHEVAFRIDLRAEIAAGRFDPKADRVGLRGSAAPLSWSQTRMAADPDGDGIHELRLHFARRPFGGQPVAYKFKIERAGQPDEGWEPGPNHPLLLEAPAQVLARAFGATPAALPLRRSGRIEALPPIASAHVGPRRVQVWLPPAYDSDNTRRYPVLYLHDGLNVFDAAEAGAEWMVDETALALVGGGALPPFIVVAVGQTADRIADYTPTAMAIHGGGGAGRYARYLVDELKPAVDARYRTRPDAASTAVGGSSLGGLVTMWLLCREGGTFGAGLVVSPSVWWDGGRILHDAAACRAGAAAAPRVWISAGGREPASMVQGARRLHEVLAARGWPVQYREDADAGHDEASWAAGVEAMLRWLYGPPPAR